MFIVLSVSVLTVCLCSIFIWPSCVGSGSENGLVYLFIPNSADLKFNHCVPSRAICVQSWKEYIHEDKNALCEIEPHRKMRHFAVRDEKKFEHIQWVNPEPWCSAECTLLPIPYLTIFWSRSLKPAPNCNFYTKLGPLLLGVGIEHTEQLTLPIMSQMGGLKPQLKDPLQRPSRLLFDGLLSEVENCQQNGHGTHRTGAVEPLWWSRAEALHFRMRLLHKLYNMLSIN
jgi:hypothetical protein